MTKKTTGLGAFGAAKQPKVERAPIAPLPQPKPAVEAEQRKRGPAKTFDKPRRGVTLRFTDAQHDAIRAFAFEERRTIQELALDGIAKLFEERGLPKPW